jgi:hypothetical protein
LEKVSWDPFRKIVDFRNIDARGLTPPPSAGTKGQLSDFDEPICGSEVEDGHKKISFF